MGRGLNEIVDKSGQVNCCEAGDIGSAKLQEGVLTICHKGATSSRFDYGMMHNDRFFLIAFEKRGDKKDAAAEKIKAEKLAKSQ